MNPIQTTEITTTLDRLRPGPYQRRETFNPAELAELAVTIRDQGLLNPPLVCAQNGHYPLLAGERRWRACLANALAASTRLTLDQAAIVVCDDPLPILANYKTLFGQTSIAVRLTQADPRQQHLYAVIDNLQRTNLNPIEEARDYQALLDDPANDIPDTTALARLIGKRKSHIDSRLDLLKLAEPVQEHIKYNRIPMAAEKHLRRLPPDQQIELADKMVGQKTALIAQAVRLIEKKQPGSHRRRQKKSSGSPAAQLTELKHLLTALTAQIWADHSLLARCADALAPVDMDLAEQAFDRSQQIERAIKRNFAV